jgi:Flp pilus assembly protein TadG
MRRTLQTRMRRRTRPGRTKPGQAMVEMALVVMILLSLTFGIADLGLFMYDYVQAANCTREAARRAAVRQDPTNIPYCVSADLAPTVSYADPGHAAGTDVTATINSTHTWIVIGFLVPGIGTTIALKSATTMRMEGAKL